jgi:histidine triad (HIT) family protein
MPLVVPPRDPCPYCENFAGRYSERNGPPAVIAEDRITSTYLNPGSMGGMPGHTLVIPRRHVETIFEVTAEEAAALGQAVARVATALRSLLDPDGVLIQQHNGEAAFQTVPHVHFHVIPKRADSPFPPPEPPPIIPYEERQAQAAAIRQHLDAAPRV